MTITEVAKLTGIPVELLRTMRARESKTLLSGPPYCKTITPEGLTEYTYNRTQVLKWIKRRSFRITAGDAASILGISRAEMLGTYSQGQHSIESRKGKLIIATSRNIYLWYPKIALGRTA